MVKNPGPWAGVLCFQPSGANGCQSGSRRSFLPGGRTCNRNRGSLHPMRRKFLCACFSEGRLAPSVKSGSSYCSGSSSQKQIGQMRWLPGDSASSVRYPQQGQVYFFLPNINVLTGSSQYQPLSSSRYSQIFSVRVLSLSSSSGKAPFFSLIASTRRASRYSSTMPIFS